jgi:hypothetical protein
MYAGVVMEKRKTTEIFVIIGFALMVLIPEYFEARMVWGPRLWYGFGYFATFVVVWLVVVVVRVLNKR